MSSGWAIYNDTNIFLYSPEESVDMKLRIASFHNVMKYDAWVQTKADIHFYDTDHKDNNKANWRVEKMARQPAEKLLQNFYTEYPNRNFSKPGDFIPIPIGGDRNKDPQEEFARVNMLGDLNMQYALRSYDFYEYLKNVGKQNENYVLYTMLVSLGVTILLFGIFFVYMLRELICMSRFYRNLNKF